MTPADAPCDCRAGRRLAGGAWWTGRLLVLVALPVLIGCGSSPTAPAGEECRQVKVLEICPTDAGRVDTTDAS